jgi:hypothetical protein
VEGTGRGRNVSGMTENGSNKWIFGPGFVMKPPEYKSEALRV